MSDKKDSKTLNEHGHYLFFGDVEEESARDVIEFIFEENLNKKNKELTLIINSAGGEMNSGFALIDVMLGSKLPVKTVGLGLIASMGLSIFIAGKKGERILTPNTSILCHQWEGGSYGKEHELLAVIKHHEQVSKRLLAHYSKHTGLKEKKVKEFLFPAHDLWLSAAEAKKFNLCDIVKDV